MHFTKQNKTTLIILFFAYFFVDWFFLRFFMPAYFIFIIQLLLVLLVFSPKGTAILRMINDCQEVQTRKDKQQLDSIFNSLRVKANLSNVKLYIDNSSDSNAYAFGSDTVVITRGAMMEFDENEIKGILAHELGHIRHGDTFILLFLMLGNIIFLFFVVLFKIIIGFFNLVANTVGSGDLMKPKFIYLFFGSITTLCLLIVNVLKSYLQQNSEFEADDYAVALGTYGGFISALYKLSYRELGTTRTIFEKINSSHPNIHKRIAVLEKTYDSRYTY